MDETIKTVRLRPTFDDAKTRAAQSNLTEDQSQALELIRKDAELDKEKNRSLEYIRTIEQLKADLNQEKAKTAEMLGKTAELEAKLNREQAKTAETLQKSADLEAIVKESVLLEARVTQLTQALARIAEIAAAGKAA